MENVSNTEIRLRRSEYDAADTKIASLAADADEVTDAVIRRAEDEYPMLLAPVAAPGFTMGSGETDRLIDFTPLRTPGRYFIDVPGVGRSEAFEIV